MTQFEYLSIAASIVLALALGKLVTAIPQVFSRSKMDWVHLLLFSWVFLACFAQWWNIWLLSSISDWRFMDFFILMLAPVALFLAVQVLVSDSPAKVNNWRAHLESRYRWFFLAAFAAAIFSFIREYNFTATPPRLLGWLLSLALFVGALTPYRLVHGLVGVIVLGISSIVFLA